MQCFFRSFFAGWLCLTLGVTLAQATEPSQRCTVAGVVTDHRGSPITHAIVSIFQDGDGKQGRMTAFSDRRGGFQLSQLAPGVYRLLATARGFQTLISEPTALTPGQTSQIHLTLRPAPSAGDVNPVKYQNRRNRSIFNATAASSEVSGLLPDTPQWQGTALLGSVGHETQMTVEATPTMDVGAYLRRDWEGQATTLGGALRYLVGRHCGRFWWQTDHVRADSVETPPAGDGSVPSRSFFRHELQAIDAWQVNDKLQLLYGFDYLRIGHSPEDVWRPRLVIHWQPRSDVRIHTALTADGQTTPTWLGPESRLLNEDFPAPPIRLAMVADRPVPARNLRIEAGVAWQPEPQTTVKVYAYQDRLGDHPLALEGRVLFRLDGHARGTALMVTHHLRPRLAVTTAYAAGRATTQPLTLPAAGTRPATEAPQTHPFSTYHLITVVAETMFPGSETHVQVGYRHAWGDPIHAIDPFAGRLPFVETGLNFRLIQSLPGWIFLPGRWEAVVEGRNLGKQRSEVTGLGAASGFPYRRTLQGGLRFRF
ncbi:MAG: carboxypeptidase-like regulatory domain-containing protein [Acidobacteriota bacterium]